MKIPTSKCEDTEEAAAAAPPSHPSLLIKFANGKPSSMGQLKSIRRRTSPVTRVKVRRARNMFAERGPAERSPKFKLISGWEFNFKKPAELFALRSQSLTGLFYFAEPLHRKNSRRDWNR